MSKEIAKELEGYAAQIREYDTHVSCHCVIVTPHSLCHSGSDFSWDFDESDPDAIRRMIGALEEIKAHALIALISATRDEEDGGSHE